MAKQGAQLSLLAGESSSDRLSDLNRKGLGAFYTPKSLTDFCARWAIRSCEDTVMDPSCGDSAFLLAAAHQLDRLANFKRSTRSKKSLFGYDLNDDAIQTSQMLLRALGELPNLAHANFFDVRTGQGQQPAVDAVIGNPPYIRYQLFREENREAGLRAAAREGVLLPRLTSSWAPFLVHASAFVKDGGRIAFVLPGELLHVGYASAVRDYLLRTYSNLTIVTFEEKVFPGALEEVLLVLGEKGNADGILNVLRLGSLRDLDQEPALLLGRARATVVPPGKRWLTALLEDEKIAEALAIPHSKGFAALGELARIDIGVVTGANDYFVINEKTRLVTGLPDRVLMKAVSKASHVQGLTHTESDWRAQVRAGAPAHLLVIDEKSLSTNDCVKKYVAQGLKAGLEQRYKCRTRTPWHLVPYRKKPDLFLTYMSHFAPRLVVNEVDATHTNTIHGVFLHDQTLAVPLAVAWLNSATLLSAEIEGRSYGGGVLKMEPREALRVLLPQMTPTLIRKLRGLFPKVDELVRERKIIHASVLVDDAVFDGASLKKLEPVRAALASLRARRFARGRSA